jgi:hypothetical protein
MIVKLVMPYLPQVSSIVSFCKTSMFILFMAELGEEWINQQ